MSDARRYAADVRLTFTFATLITRCMLHCPLFLRLINSCCGRTHMRSARPFILHRSRHDDATHTCSEHNSTVHGPGYRAQYVREKLARLQCRRGIPFLFFFFPDGRDVTAGRCAGGQRTEDGGGRKVMVRNFSAGCRMATSPRGVNECD